MIVALPFEVVIGIALGMLGGGGSILVVPVLVVVLGQDAHDATTASLVIVTIAAVAGSLGQARGGNVCWRHAAIFTAAALPAIALGTALGDAVSGAALLGAFAAVMLAAAYATARKADSRPMPSGSARPCPALRPGWDAGLGAVVGFLTGLLGVGGGFVVVPALVIALGFPLRKAIGTSLAVITATGVAGAVFHLAAGRSLDADVTLALSAAMVFGAFAGARAAARLPERGLARGFSVLVTTVALYLLVTAAFLGGPPGAG